MSRKTFFWFQIVGVVRDALNNVPEQQALPELYIPHAITGIADQLIVRAMGRQPVTSVRWRV